MRCTLTCPRHASAPKGVLDKERKQEGKKRKKNAVCLTYKTLYCSRLAMCLTHVVLQLICSGVLARSCHVLQSHVVLQSCTLCRRNRSCCSHAHLVAVMHMCMSASCRLEYCVECMWSSVKWTWVLLMHRSRTSGATVSINASCRYGCVS
mmetsp:Transcript_77834/g.126272  ORF Transcript_77834/g.126272 Transcript_77834/m.126272 type:complete len:150 (+) Transcript_77834:850-1299(+)